MRLYLERMARVKMGKSLLPVFSYCIECNKEIPYSINVYPSRITVRNVTFDCYEIHAFCRECGAEVYVPEINDKNVEIREKAYFEAKERKK